MFGLLARASELSLELAAEGRARDMHARETTSSERVLVMEATSLSGME
jgi:hypothetical protein